MVTKRILNLFLAASILEIIHMPLELWLFRIDHTYYTDAKAVFDGIINALTPISQNADEAFILMVGVFGVLWLGTNYLSLRGGKWQLVVVIFFSLLFISEIHHLIRSFMLGVYYPGTIAGFILVVLGILLLWEATKAWKQQ
ncbi:MAG: hypothetical protein A2Z24_01305 [Candidatus Woykebacteria bacterium RBG_16_44_10]|uniref:HXXEE domain-containing protein n=1 Tax=Candidatus Woykebacteria bacterium RBG_16_44_10 TaxID=1802597 RepID=A0A1G1WET8_9BACT|nr:MAG: hypothetical protein A2Z24_01305 [Candidatus Woykebacteria bacterium RBG_16_44_10]